MSTAFHQTDPSTVGKWFTQWHLPAFTWRKPQSSIVPETAVYATLFVWVGAQHDFAVASVIASALAVFCWFLPR